MGQQSTGQGEDAITGRMPNTTITKFVDACMYNQVPVVRRMLSEGVDINARDSSGRTGLYRAMSNNKTDTVRLLLGHSDIQIDSTDSITDLHTACHNDSFESVRLFLAHPACTKDIVSKVSRVGTTAEMVAKIMGNHGCARLVREYLEKVDKPAE